MLQPTEDIHSPKVYHKRHPAGRRLRGETLNYTVQIVAKTERIPSIAAVSAPGIVMARMPP